MSTLQEKLESTVEQHNNVVDKISELNEARQQLLGQAQLLQEMIEEETPSDEVIDADVVKDEDVVEPKTQ